MPFFSVVIPTYNRAEQLRQTVQTVIDQTYGDFEVLVMDDGSNDHTQRVVEEFNDSRIRYDWAENSGGPATPRNRGIDAAKGEWVCFLDADDFWYPEKLEEVASAIEANPEVDGVCHNENLYIVDSGEKTLLRHGPYERSFYRKMLTGGNRLSTSATTIRREFLNRYNLRFNQSPGYVIVEDFDLWLRVAFHGGEFCFIDEVLGDYVIEKEGNISSNTKKLRENSENLLRDHVYKVQQFESNKDKLWRQVSVKLEMQSVKDMLAARNYTSALIRIVQLFFISPLGMFGYMNNFIRHRM